MASYDMTTAERLAIGVHKKADNALFGKKVVF